ncbi:hypothetical protein [Candidatus Viadribacter manganicus]|uniref:Uncharacterized protein n=1 Tax=Candidatus Viadribacter manganicus TaxID=1759059 RepID=A0A1B1AFY4_9PROT|nr:hypothetical protein [Candidatus Viadribacter manganicus]ANP45445.1 hypothetical protein ATE48_05700 [Candidatus Viadribacter manganicus]
MAGLVRNATFAALAIVALAGSPANAQSASAAQDLSYCAGAVAAHANLDVLSYPQGATGAWAPVLGRILDALNREPGVEGMTGRYAASASKGYWQEQPTAQRTAAANECRTRFAS